MRISARLVVIALALLLALVPAAAARNIVVSVTQTNADLSQALTTLPQLRFRPGSPSRRLRVITIDDTQRFQTMQGFGAAMTDTSAWLIWDTPDAPAAELAHAETIRPWPERNRRLVCAGADRRVRLHTGKGAVLL